MAKGPSEKFKSSKKGGKSKSLSKSALSEVKQASDYAKKIGSDKTFSDLVKEYKQANVKYDRPATFRENYGDEVNKVGTPLASTYYKDPTTGQERFFTAQAPTFKQLMGDVGRGLFSGYNTLSYDPNARGTPTTTGGQIVRQKGLIPSLIDQAMQGKVGITGAVKGLWDKVRGYFTPSQTPQGIETQFPRVSPEARGYFGGYNQGIQTQIPVANDRGMIFPSYTTPQIQPNEMSNQQFQQEYPFLYDQSGIGGYLPEGFTGIGLPSIPPLSENKFFENQYLVDASQSDIDRINKMRQLKSMDPQSIYDMRDIFQLSPELTLEDIQGIREGTINQPTGIFAKNGGSVDKYAGLGYKFK